VRLDVKRAAQAAFILASPTKWPIHLLPVQKIFKKSEKKACQLLGSPINEGTLRTNQLIFRSKIFSKK
jgi:hypothetical protein